MTQHTVSQPEVSQPEVSQPDPSRRTVLRTVGMTGAVGAVALTVAACGGGDAAEPATSPAASAAGTALTKVADVPVGGGSCCPR